ncbi:putative short-chain dehydrogenase reductase protein, partial [Botrytis fragariae]
FIVKVPPPRTSFEGKTIIITGRNTGLGFEAAKFYLKLKASRVILACRSLEKVDQAKLELEQTFAISKDIVETWQVDLSSYTSAKSLPRLDVMLLNAGIMTKEYRVAKDNESTITVNVILTFLMAF